MSMNEWYLRPQFKRGVARVLDLLRKVAMRHKGAFGRVASLIDGIVAWSSDRANQAKLRDVLITGSDFISVLSPKAGVAIKKLVALLDSLCQPAYAPAASA